MKIENGKTYMVTKYQQNGTNIDYGRLPGEDVKRLLKGYDYDENYGLWFSPKANCGYDIEEAE